MATTHEYRGGVVMAVALAVLAATVHAQNGSQFRDWRQTALADTRSQTPHAPCAGLVSLTGYELSVTTATTLAASSDAPEYCRVSGLIQPEIRFEVDLPSAWNGRLYMFGNGGYAGEQLDAAGRVATARRALLRGFAVAQSNTGHDAVVEPLGTFAASPQKMADYAYRAVHVTTLTAKRVLQAYYDGPPSRSYFDGCSTGGRQGLIAAQRFPDDFDGIVVGAPVLDFSGTMISYASIQRALASAPIPAAKLKLIADVVYAKCDAIDGVSDGLIDDPRRCTFSAAADLPRCADGAGGATCMTAAEIHALETIYGGVTRNGEKFFPGWPVGAEIAAPGVNGAPASGWLPWFVPGGSAPPIQKTFGETFFRFMAFGRPNPTYDWMTFNIDADLDKLQPARAMLDAIDPDLSRFKTRGGKIVSYFGWADPALNPMMGVRYYEAVMQRLGPSTTDFYRLFMVPGMFHCGGGIGVNTFDALTPLVEWVERGAAPPAIAGSRIVNSATVRTRPLCPYPQVAKYKGSGSIDAAASFACDAPSPGATSPAEHGRVPRP